MVIQEKVKKFWGKSENFRLTSHSSFVYNGGCIPRGRVFCALFWEKEADRSPNGLLLGRISRLEI